MTNVSATSLSRFTSQWVVCLAVVWGNPLVVYAAPVPNDVINRVYVDARVTSNPAEVYAWIENQGQVALPLPNAKLLGGTVKGYFEYDPQATSHLILGDAVRQFEFSSVWLEVRGSDDSLIHSITTAPNGFRVIEGGLHLFLGPSAPSQTGYQLRQPTDIRITLLGGQFSHHNPLPPTPAELIAGNIDTTFRPTIYIDRTNPFQSASGWSVPFESFGLYTIPEPKAYLLMAASLGAFYWLRRERAEAY
ncbi:hypothetical protein [Aeoliella sp. SH292]|uniref:hypothetical protein n=1 Tax=Aeoliella sp. SH292 TaxID=3454464 RepID=UPI003F98319E